MPSGLSGLESLLGDPRDGDNPVSYAEIVRADERGELLAAGEDALTSWAFNAEFVPPHLGGRLRAADELVRRIRPVFRRDIGLGLGYGVTSLMAAVNVWSAGTGQQQRRAAELLLRGDRLAVAYHELAHGNDFSRNEFEARWEGERVRLSGTKELINNIARAAAFVLFARTEHGGGPRGHSLFLVENDTAGLAHLPRTRTVGVRGVQLGGLLARDCAVPAGALLGDRGQGVETALRSFQVTRAVLPGLAVGAVDTALRTVVRFATSRRLYGATVLDLPHSQEALAGAFVDLLVADALATVACRGLHLLPAQASLHAAATKYLVARLLTDATEDLAVILGARYYLREGPGAIFGKHLRDLPVISLGHAGETACLLAIIAQLPALSRRAWREPATPPPALFDPAAALPELAFTRLALSSSGRDDITGLLLSAAAHGPEAGIGPDAGALVASLSDQLRTLAERASAIPPLRRGPLADAETFALAENYAMLLGAAAAVGVWRAGHARGDAFLGAPRWLTAALARLHARLTRTAAPLPDGTVEWLLGELVCRERDGLSLDLSRTPVLT
ncbi:acyl-CoA dehydrogenase [Phytohabitans aurantiacus]|uniref:Acyl-CoA dehydrogenase n=1 Tax=Phytohabitans aurantiacus TaxID=3016789 RepID=A0ABQ5QS42_9ACTN|nr:acyl-CoA dehydrogenase [Phytohabitans aurantiacus]GLH96524.1 acyl-CoA dehydrogenase [Phytohabitans aurantiacus]